MTLKADPSARISSLADIEASVRGTVFSVGANTSIESFVKIKPVGGEGNITIGDSCYINSGCVLYSGNGILIGHNVLIGPNCNLMPVNHKFHEKNKTIISQRFAPSKGGIIIEDDVWIGAGCTILDGAILRRGCVIGAMSMVRGEVPEYSIYAGNPLRHLGDRS